MAHLNIPYSSTPFTPSQQSTLVAQINADGAKIVKTGSYTGSDPFAAVGHRLLVIELTPQGSISDEFSRVWRLGGVHLAWRGAA